MAKMGKPKGKGKFDIEKNNKGTSYKRSPDTKAGAMGKGTKGKNPKVKAYGSESNAQG
jgi:hypothetical protein